MNTIDEYIVQYHPEIQVKLQKIRAIIHEIAPDIVETISYQMPAFLLHGKPLAYFAVFKKHIGFYPAPTGIDKFKKDLSVYKLGKGSVQFPLKKPVPFELIKRMAQFRKSVKCYLSNM